MEIKELKNGYEDIILNTSVNGKILLIDSIVLKEKYQNKKSKELITKNITKLMKNRKYRNIIILASTEFEKDIANYLKFKKLIFDFI